MVVYLGASSTPLFLQLVAIMSSTNTSVTVSFFSSSATENSISVEQDSGRWSPQGTCYFKVYSNSGSYDVFMAGGEGTLLGEIEDTQDVILSYNNSNSASLNAGYQLDTLESIGSFYDKDGKPVVATFSFNKINGELTASVVGFGLVRVKAKVKYYLYFFKFLWNIKGFYETAFVGVIDRITKNTASTNLSASTEKDEPYKTMIVIEQDSSVGNGLNRSTSASSAPSLLVAAAGIKVYSLDSVQGSANVGTLLLDATTISEDRVETVDFSNSSTASIRYPSIGGATIRTTNMTSTYFSFLGPGQTYMADSSGKIVEVPQGSIVSVDQYNKPYNVTGTVSVEYTTQYQKGTYLFEYDTGTYSFLPGKIIVDSGNTTASTVLNPPNIKVSK